MGRLNATEEELTYHVVDDRRAIRSPWGKGNSKIGAGIYTYSRLPGRLQTCPGSTDLCEEVCYSKRITFNPILSNWMWENTVRPDVPPLPADAKVVRIHVSGDFNTVEYVCAWIAACKGRPDVAFFAYTRSWRVPLLWHYLEGLKLLPNVQLFASMDRSTLEAAPRGWRCAWLGAGFGITCPEEVGKKENCETCTYCFRGKRGDVVFPIHGEGAKDGD